MALYRLGAAYVEESNYPTRDSQLEALAIQNLEYVNSLTADIPDSILDNDITLMSKTEFLSFMGYPVQGLVYDSTPAFIMPEIQLSGETVGSIFSKIGDALKTAWKKILNFIMKGGIQKAAPALIYAFIDAKKSINSVVDTKAAKARAMVDYLAQKTGTSKDTMMKTLAASIQANGKDYRTELNGYFKQTVAGTGAKMGWVTAVLAAAPAILDVINKIIGFFKKNDAPPVDMLPEDGDYTYTPPFVPSPVDSTSPQTVPTQGNPNTNNYPNPNPIEPNQGGGNGGVINQGGGINDALPLLLGAGLLYVMSNR